MHWLYIYKVDVIRATASFFMENDRWKFTELSKSAATHTQLKLRFAAQTQTQPESLQKNVELGKY